MGFTGILRPEIVFLYSKQEKVKIEEICKRTKFFTGRVRRESMMEKNKTLIIFTDSGDTIIDEASQVYDAQEPGIVSREEFIENAGEILQQLHEEGYTIALVADGEEASFQNVYRKNGLRSCFDAWVVSETVGQQKPEAIMFQTAMEQLGLEEKDKKRIVMIGNNLKKDIAGANRFGITSIWLDWSPRYYRTIEEEDWRPDYTVHHPSELPALLEELNRKLEDKAPGR